MDEFTAAQLNEEPMLRFFACYGLEAPEQKLAAAFCRLASDIVELLPENFDRHTALLKLLEAKRASVRSCAGPVYTGEVLENNVRLIGGDQSETAIPFTG